MTPGPGRGQEHRSVAGRASATPLLKTKPPFAGLHSLGPAGRTRASPLALRPRPPLRLTENRGEVYSSDSQSPLVGAAQSWGTRAVSEGWAVGAWGVRDPGWVPSIWKNNLHLMMTTFKPLFPTSTRNSAQSPPTGRGTRGGGALGPTTQTHTSPKEAWASALLAHGSAQGEKSSRGGVSDPSIQERQATQLRSPSEGKWGQREDVALEQVRPGFHPGPSDVGHLGTLIG